MVVLSILALITAHFRRSGQHLGQLQGSVIILSNSEVELFDSTVQTAIGTLLSLWSFYCLLHATYPQDSGSLCQGALVF